VHRDGKFLTELNWKDMDYPRQFNLTMLGGVQGYNAALIILCIKSLLPNISQEKITRGIQSANLPGRGEWIKGSPDILMDGAHTAKSLKNLMDLLQYFPQEPKILLFGCAADKDSAAMAKEIAGHFNQVIITTPGSFKRSDPPRVFKIFKEQKIPCMAIYNEKAAYKKARELAGDRGILLITGSFFLISEIKSLG
jgi:dihydrofolate synthase/folylpolyglutamate synthase